MVFTLTPHITSDCRGHFDWDCNLSFLQDLSPCPPPKTPFVLILVLTFFCLCVAADPPSFFRCSLSFSLLVFSPVFIGVKGAHFFNSVYCPVFQKSFSNPSPVRNPSFPPVGTLFKFYPSRLKSAIFQAKIPAHPRPNTTLRLTSKWSPTNPRRAFLFMNQERTSLENVIRPKPSGRLPFPSSPHPPSPLRRPFFTLSLVPFRSKNTSHHFIFKPCLEDAPPLSP